MVEIAPFRESELCSLQRKTWKFVNREMTFENWWNLPLYLLVELRPEESVVWHQAHCTVPAGWHEFYAATRCGCSGHNSKWSRQKNRECSSFYFLCQIFTLRHDFRHHWLLKPSQQNSTLQCLSSCPECSTDCVQQTSLVLEWGYGWHGFLWFSSWSKRRHWCWWICRRKEEQKNHCIGLDWAVCYVPANRVRLYGRRFLQVKRPKQQYQSTEGTGRTTASPRQHWWLCRQTVSEWVSE